MTAGTTAPGKPRYPEYEKCERDCGRMARYRVLDGRGYELAVCCQECAGHFVNHFEDCDGNEFNP